MPNWIEGTMKLRGEVRNIKRFFEEGLDASQWVEPEKLEDQVKNESSDCYMYFTFFHEPHIVGTRRAFITDDSVYCDFEEPDEECVVCINVKQAWCFTTEGELDEWKAVSDNFDLDVKLFGIECGMEFTQEVICLRGHKPILNERHYENWDWDCPFPNMGG